MWDRLPLTKWSHGTLPPPWGGGFPIILKFSHRLVRSFKGTSRHVATGSWGKLHTVATQGLRGWKTPWHRAMRLSLPCGRGRGRGRQWKGEGTPGIQPALVGAQRGASNRKDQGCVVSNAHTSQIFGACVAASSLCAKAGKSMLLHTVTGLFPLPRQKVSLQAPGLQDQPVLCDHLHILATQRLPQPHLHLQLAPSGLPSI